ncbi:MAG: RNA-binding S4 domain-containing protein [Bacilli bacterium]|nr:RNA-binding S4 domain-containing protein [Bacilli bacterium]
MRLDKYLKVSRIIKRRIVAANAASSERVLVNNNIAKPSKDIKVGDIITIEYFKRKLVVKVLEVKENVKAQDADKMYEVLEMNEAND